MSCEKTIELGHHILKAHIYKNVGKQRGYSSRDMQAFWMALSSSNLSAALVEQRNLFYPNVKVCYYSKDLFVNGNFSRQINSYQEQLFSHFLWVALKGSASDKKR